MNLEVYLDSELLANQINGSYRVKNENLKVLMNEVRGLLTSFDSSQVKHVLRSLNSHADRLRILPSIPIVIVLTAASLCKG